MSQSYIPGALRQRVGAEACHRCGYCLTAVSIVGMPMEIDHIVPEARGGTTVEENLWLACTMCNLYKGDQTTAKDPLGGEVVALFHPRAQEWSEHFAWVDEGAQILGLTAVGRATVAALRLNRRLLVTSRRK